METTAKPITDLDFDWGNLSACHKGQHAELLKVKVGRAENPSEVGLAVEAFCPRCGIVVEVKKERRMS